MENLLRFRVCSSAINMEIGVRTGYVRFSNLTLNPKPSGFGLSRRVGRTYSRGGWIKTEAWNYRDLGSGGRIVPLK